jgi:hypothetical protein
MVNTYAIVEGGIVTNVILWDGEADWTPPVGSTVNLLPEGSPVGVGYTTSDGVSYVAPATDAPAII